MIRSLCLCEALLICLVVRGQEKWPNDLPKGERDGAEGLRQEDRATLCGTSQDIEQGVQTSIISQAGISNKSPSRRATKPGRRFVAPVKLFCFALWMRFQCLVIHKADFPDPPFGAGGIYSAHSTSKETTCRWVAPVCAELGQ